MARIPLGNFGNAIAQAAPVVHSAPIAVANDGAGLKQAGDAILHVGNNMLDEERQQTLLLTRAKAANAVLDREISVKTIGHEISQQVEAGQLHYDEAPKVFKQRMTDLGTPDMTGLDPVTAEKFTGALKAADFHGEGLITGAIHKARQADFRTQADGVLDKLGKEASLPGADPEKLSERIAGMDEIGQRAYGAGWAKKKQDWVDGNWDAHLNQKAMTVRDDLAGIADLEKQITEGQYADKLDSNRRNSILTKLAALKAAKIHSDEAKAARAERLQERALKKAEAEFNTFQVMADKGTILSPEYISRAVQMTAGTPYQQGVKMLAQQAQETGGLASQPVAAQEAMLTQVDTLIAQRGRTPELDKRREQIQKVLTGSESDLKANGLRAGLERGVIKEMSPLDVSTPEAFAASAAGRLSQAEQVSQWAGKPVSPLDAREAEQVRGMLDALPPKQKSQAVATIAAAVGPRLAGALATQVEKQDKALALAFATAGSSTTEGRYTSELILKGATAIKDGVVMKDDKKVTGWRATIAQELDGVFPNEVAAAAAKDAAYYIAAGLAQENGGSLSSKKLRDSVRLAIDGDIIEHKGKRIPIPAGWSEDDFAKGLRNAVAGSDIQKQAPDGKVLVGGVPMAVADFAATVPGQELIYAGPGRYAVVVKGRPVKNSAGQVITVKVQ